MKRNSLPILAVFSLGLSLLSGFSLSQKPAVIVEADNATLPTTNIKLKDTAEEDIRDYYSALNDLAPAERTGDKLLEHLKPILKNGMKYYSYINVWKIYEITDRDWDLSPAENDTYNGTAYDAESETYTTYKYGSSSSDPGNDPYVHTLYRDRSNENARIKEWGLHTGDNATNREHVWCQSRGFKGRDGSDAAYGPAGTDVHHLISGDCKVNTNYHNDLPYGNVDKTKAYKDASAEFDWLSGNLVGSPIKVSTLDTQTQVFEPRDEDKGDIARACFYMVARYNNLAGETGVISDYEPNLALADYATGTGVAEYSSDTQPVYMGIMSDLLAWNKLDPVDEYEIHRNNLIYENYQHNRNPFVDFPQWADYIWGDGRGQKAAVPSVEQLNTFTTVDADLVGGLDELFEAEQTKARLRFTYNSEIVVGDSEVTWRASDIAYEHTYSEGYSADLGNGISFTVGSSTSKYDGTRLIVYKNSPMTVSIADGYLSRVKFTVNPTDSGTGKFADTTKNPTTVSSGFKSISSGNLTVTLTGHETSLTVTQTNNSTYLSAIEVEYYGPSKAYSGFTNAEIQFGYDEEIPNNAHVSDVGIFVTDDPTYFATTAKGEGFIPANPDDLADYVAENKHNYISKNTSFAKSWTVGIKVDPSLYATTFYAAAYIFIDEQVTFAKVSNYSLTALLEAYSGMYTLSLEELAIITAFQNEINQ